MPERPRQALETVLAEAPRADFRIRLRQALERSIAMTTIEARIDIPTVIPCVSVIDVDGVVAFAREVFGARELDRLTTGAGVTRCIVGLGDSLLMCAGGPAAAGRETFAALHVYVPDVDQTYQQALDAGATPLAAPRDKPYGARDATVKDSAGNLWFVATRRAGAEPPVRLRTVTPWLIAEDPLGLIAFLKEAFSATEVGIHMSPDGRLLHGALSIGDSVLEFGQAEGMPPAGFYLFVPDPERIYEQALRAGARSRSEVIDQGFGHHALILEDAWGNTWYIASQPPFDSP
jgi:PhnB protein